MAQPHNPTLNPGHRRPLPHSRLNTRSHRPPSPPCLRSLQQPVPRVDSVNLASNSLQRFPPSPLNKMFNLPLLLLQPCRATAGSLPHRCYATARCPYFVVTADVKSVGHGNVTNSGIMHLYGVWWCMGFLIMVDALRFTSIFCRSVCCFCFSQFSL